MICLAFSAQYGCSDMAQLTSACHYYPASFVLLLRCPGHVVYWRDGVADILGVHDLHTVLHGPL